MTQTQEFTRDVQEFAQNIVDTVREPLLTLDTDLRVQSANRAFYRAFGVTPGETTGRRVYDLGDGQWDVPALRRLLEEIIPANTAFDDFEVAHDFPGVGHRVMLLNARKVYRPGNHTGLLLLAMEDITERRATEERLRAQQDRLDEEQRQLREMYERDHRLAQALTRPLTLAVPEDAFAGLSVATLYSAAWADRGEAVGGDFFDAVPLADGRVALLVGDASGKGVTAAARATEVKDVLRAFLRVYPHYPALTLTRLNDYLCDLQSLDDRAHDTFVALSLAVIDVRRSAAVLAWAGIEPPILARAGGSAAWAVGGGLPLGAQEREVYVDVTVPFNAGDTLVLSTDGLTEARRGREFLDPAGVLALVEGSLGEPTVRGMGEAILSGARTFAGGQLQDDACVVLARRA